MPKKSIFLSGHLTLSVMMGFLFFSTIQAISSTEMSAKSTVVKLDTTIIRKQYLEGEFDKVSTSLEAWRNAGSKGTHEDSVFAFRHLGIVNAFSEANRTKAESYFNLLLRLEPELEILDAFVSARVDALWDQVRERHAKVTGRPISASSQSQNPATEIKKTNNNSETVTNRTERIQEKTGFPWLLTIGSLAVVGGAVTSYYFWDQSQESSGTPIDPGSSLETADVTIKVFKKP